MQAEHGSELTDQTPPPDRIDQWEPTRCPLCAPTAPDATAPASRRLFEAEDHLFGFPGRFTLVRCTSCNSLRLDPRPEGSALGQYYGRYYIGPGLETSEGLQLGSGNPQYNPARISAWSRWKEILGALGEALAPPAAFIPGQHGTLRVLDVGCGLGGFLHHISGDPRVNPLGVENATIAVQYARQRLKLDVLISQAESLPFADRTVDVVTLWHALEHSTDPERALAEAWRVLRPGGVVAVEVPSGRSLLLRMFGRHWFFLQPPTHLHLFQPAALRKLMVRVGFQPYLMKFPYVPTELLGSLYYWWRRPHGLPVVKPGFWRTLGVVSVALGIELPLLTVLRQLGRSGVVRIVARKDSAAMVPA